MMFISHNLRLLLSIGLFHIVFLALLGCFPGLSEAESKFVTASTKYGEIKGTVLPYAQSSTRIKTVKAFLGVPFASPPIGDLRFKPPQPPQAWRPQVYDATQFRNACIQFPSTSISMRIKSYTGVKNPRSRLSEDCLYLNIAEPGIPPSLGKYPVMVFVHGGGFQGGLSFDVTGFQLALREVVVVSIQYRLGPFGFLTTMDGMAPGNQGLLDQVAALKWVQENIKYFNGDPDRVTILGNSAGGVSVALHVLSPLSRGLFRNAIAMSGVAVAPWATCVNTTLAARATALARELGCQYESSREMITCLQSKDAWALLNASAHVAFKPTTKLYVGFSWLATVDRHFLPDDPATLRRKGEFNKVPYISGVTTDEYSFFLKYRFRGKIDLRAGINDSVFEEFIRQFAHMVQPSEQHGRVLTDAMLFEYFPWPKYPPRDYSSELVQQTIGFGSDFYFFAPMQESLLAHSKLAPVYMYVFGHRSNLSRAPAWQGVAHSHNYPYVLGAPSMDQSKYDMRDKNISDAMVTLWTNFAKYGDPSPTGQEVFGSKWNRFNLTNQVYIRFGGKDIVKMERNFHGSRVAFWNYFHPKLVKESCEKQVESVSSHVNVEVATLLVGLSLIATICT